jgi:hypothetical protein
VNRSCTGQVYTFISEVHGQNHVENDAAAGNVEEGGCARQWLALLSSYVSLHCKTLNVPRSQQDSWAGGQNFTKQQKYPHYIELVCCLSGF